MLDYATVSLWMPWGTMTFHTELSRGTPSQFGYFDVGMLF